MKTNSKVMLERGKEKCRLLKKREKLSIRETHGKRKKG